MLFDRSLLIVIKVENILKVVATYLKESNIWLQNINCMRYNGTLSVASRYKGLIIL